MHIVGSLIIIICDLQILFVYVFVPTRFARSQTAALGKCHQFF